MAELKHCPFCGAQPWGIFGPRPDGLGKWWVECHGPDDNTGCGDWYCTVDSDDRTAARAEVAAAWNRRTAGVAGTSDASAWWALVMGAAASIEDAANCLRDPDAKKQAEGAAKHYREAAQKLWAADGVAPSDRIAQIKGEVAELSAAIQTGDGAKVTELGAAYFGVAPSQAQQAKGGPT